MIAVTKSYLPNKEKLFRYIDQIYASCQLTNNGPLVQALEEKLAKHLEVRNLILVANGTLALQVVYKAMNLQGSVVTTPFSFPATTSSLVWEFIKPIFADIDQRSWNINPKEIEKLIQPNTSAIVATHIFSNPCEVEAIQKIAEHYHLKVIYDGAHTFGVRYQGESVLKWGDATTLSFHATKLFHTVEGGAIITNDDALAEKIRLMINFGIAGPEKIIDLGINAKLNEFQAAIGLCILDEINHINQERKKVWHCYYEELKNTCIFQMRNEFSTNNYSYFPILFENENKMKEIQKKLNDQSIFPRRYFYPSLDELPYIKQERKMMIARDVASRVLCLPLYPGLALDVIKEISHMIKNEYVLAY
ncbi:MAG: aminotransferase DegT [Gammaproteobacteria bacterium RIFCSPHIGHO2_12_FULL_42_10]|nr:MAG: aminotransferase DegT [Gammaproteobacteria bacterium RIFCSPHIGHO2_12_FULL_42_10]